VLIDHFKRVFKNFVTGKKTIFDKTIVSGLDAQANAEMDAIAEQLPLIEKAKALRKHLPDQSAVAPIRHPSEYLVNYPPNQNKSIPPTQ